MRIVRPRWLATACGICLLSCRPCTGLSATRSVEAPPSSAGDGVCGVDPDAPECVATRPRCGPADPGCGPLPSVGYADCYRPDAERKPLFAAGRTAPDCGHDGDCRLAGCGKLCVGFRQPAAGAASTCELPGWLNRDDLLCGCVEQRCAFFTQ